MCFPITLDYAAEIVITLRCCDLHFKSRRESFESVSYTWRLCSLLFASFCALFLLFAFRLSPFAFVNCNFSIDMPRDTDENSPNIHMYISRSHFISLCLANKIRSAAFDLTDAMAVVWAWVRGAWHSCKNIGINYERRISWRGLARSQKAKCFRLIRLSVSVCVARLPASYPLAPAGRFLPPRPLPSASSTLPLHFSLLAMHRGRLCGARTSWFVVESQWLWLLSLGPSFRHCLFHSLYLWESSSRRSRCGHC